MTLELRPYREGDERQISELFETVFGKPLELDFWRWRYRDHPGGGPHAELAWDGDKLAGHYAVSASPLSVDGHCRPAALSMTTMVHPDYRGQRLFEILASRLYDRLVGGGFAAVYGFPNPNSHRGFLSRLEWQSIYEIPTLRLDVTRARPGTAPSQVEQINEFGAEFDTHWAKIRTRHRIWTWRDAAYLRWRYTDRPDEDYAVAAWQVDGVVWGYIVTKVYGNGLDIVDLIADNAEVSRGLIDHAIGRAVADGLEVATIWSPVDAPQRINLESAGFQAVGPVTYFGGRPLTALPADFSNPRNWYFAMSDSDIF